MTTFKKLALCVGLLLIAPLAAAADRAGAAEATRLNTAREGQEGERCQRFKQG